MRDTKPSCIIRAAASLRYCMSCHASSLAQVLRGSPTANTVTWQVAAGWPAEEFAAAATGALQDGVAEPQTLQRVAAARGLPLPA